MSDSKREKVVIVTDSGIQFGGAWFSHEGITGYSAEQLNSGDCKITGRQYVKWLSDDSSDAQSQLAALREELAKEKERSAQYGRSFNETSRKLNELQPRLADAERRNSDCAAKLEFAASMMDDDERGNRFAEVCRLAIAALNPNPEAASHDE